MKLNSLSLDRRLVLETLSVFYTPVALLRLMATLEVCSNHTWGRSLGNHSFDATWMETLPDGIVGPFCDVVAGVGQPQAQSWLERWLLRSPGQECSEARAFLAWRAALGGRLSVAEELIGLRPGPATGEFDCLRAAFLVMRGCHEEAARLFQDTLARFRKFSGRRALTLRCPAAALFGPALIGSGRLEEAATLAAAVLRESGHPLRQEHRWLERAVSVLEGRPLQEEILAKIYDAREAGIAGLLAWSLPIWSGTELFPWIRDSLERVVEKHREEGSLWLAAQWAEIVARRWPDFAPRAAALATACEVSISLLDIARSSEAWDKQLSALERLVGPQEASPAANPKAERLIWLLTPWDDGSTTLTPKLQKRKADGWTGGRAVSLSSLRSDPPDCLTPADLEVCRYIRNGNYGATREYIATDEAIPSLIGHPLVFAEADPSAKIEVRSGRLTLTVSRAAEDLKLCLEPQCPPGKRNFCMWIDVGKLSVFRLNDTEVELGKLLQQPSTFPPEARPRLRRVLDALESQIELRWEGGEATRQLCRQRPHDPLADELVAVLSS